VRRAAISSSALRLHQIDDPEDTADAIDDLVLLALRQSPKTSADCVALIDLVISGLKRDQQPRLDRADIEGLRAVQHYLRGVS